jgi:hypothetical protein
MIKTLASALTLFGMLAAAPLAARAESVSEPSTGHSFDSLRTVDGRPFTLLGTGVRKKFIVKVYAMALYVDQEAARGAFPALVNRAGGSDKAHLTASDHATLFVSYGSFGKVGVLHFVRNVEAEKIRGAYEESLADEIAGKSGPEVQEGAKAFVALFDKDLKDGEEIVIHTGGDGHVEISQAGAKKSGPTNPKLARAIWNIWLGPKTISADMRKSLVERIDLLGK